jgi:hypothetical protein
MNRKALLIVLTIAIAVVASACSSSSPTVTITTPPPASLEINQSASMAATTTHDGGAGVDWSCAPAGSCGTISPTHTDSGASTTYTAPSVSGSVTITAASTKKPSVTATSTVTVTPIATSSNLTGQYAFKIIGFDTFGDAYAAAGSVTLDGAGNVTAGEEDLNNTSYVGPVLGDLLTGTYTVGDDGQGTMVLTATTGGNPDPLVGVDGVQTLAFTVVNSSHALVTEFDAAATSGGTLDAQSADAIAGGFVGNYAFNFGGFLDGAPWAFGGVGTAVLGSPNGTFDGTGDQDIAGAVDMTFETGGLTTPADANGRGTVVFGGVTMAYYIVTGEAVYFTEIDAGSVTWGAAYGQGASAPAFNAASISGNMVMDQPWAPAESVDGPSALAGQFTSDGVSAIAGVLDYNEGGFINPGPGPDTLTASYAVAASGYSSFTAGVVSNNADFTTWGVYLTDPTVNLVDPNNASGGGGALTVELDLNSLGAGFILPQSATALTGVNNATDFTADNSNFDLINSVGQVIGGNSTATGTASVNDINPNTPSSTQTTGASVSGTYTADATNVGRYTLSITVGDEAAPENRVAYVTSSGLAVMVDVDSTSTFIQVGSGTVQGQQ